MQPRSSRNPNVRVVRRQLSEAPERPVRRPRRRPVFLLLILLAGLVGGGYYLWQQTLGTPEAALVAVRFGTLQTTVEADALIVRREVVVRSPVAGRVERLIAEGERVRVGTPVVGISAQTPSSRGEQLPSRRSVSTQAGAEGSTPAVGQGTNDLAAQGTAPAVSQGATQVIAQGAAPAFATASQSEPASLSRATSAQALQAQREFERLNVEIYQTALRINHARMAGEEVWGDEAQLEQLARQQADLLPLVAQQGGPEIQPPPLPPLTEATPTPEPPAASPEEPPVEESSTEDSSEPPAPPTTGTQERPLENQATLVPLPGGGGTGVATSTAGIVLYTVDGLEELLLPERVASWQPSSLRALPYPEQQETAAGTVAVGSPLYKLVEDHNLELLLVTSAQNLAPSLRANLVDRRVELKVAGRDQLLQAKVLRVAEEGGQVLIHLSLPLPSADSLQLRRLRVTLNLERFEGVILPRSAIDVQNGQTGVWRAQGSKFRFQPVQVLGGDQQEVAVQGEFARDAQVLQHLPPSPERILD